MVAESTRELFQYQRRAKFKKKDFKHTINALLQHLECRKIEASLILFPNKNQFTFQ
jgi:hypothetical protein